MVVNNFEGVCHKHHKKKDTSTPESNRTNENRKLNEVVWLEDTIAKLTKFRDQVADGSIHMIDGDLTVTRPVPAREHHTFDYISLSIDYVEIKSQNQTI